MRAGARRITHGRECRPAGRPPAAIRGRRGPARGHAMEQDETEDQSAALALLEDPATHGGAETQHIETHCAHVILAGERAYKIKRAVHYDYLDFSTMAKRRAVLEREYALNAPAAPSLYLRIGWITEEADGRLALEGAGRPAEPVLVMRRFPAEAELARIAADGQLDRPLAEALGRAVAAYHGRAETRHEDGAELIVEILEELDTAFDRRAEQLGQRAVSAFRDVSACALAQVSSRLSERGASGRVRRCHGDLHLGNLVMIEGRPVPFDALEFDERLGTCDVLYDLAFVIMDLLHRGLAAPANAALGSYLYHAETPEHLDGLAAMPLFLGLRAGIRAMVNVQAGRLSEEDATASYAEARRYLDQGNAYLLPQAPLLVAVGGISGTGKTSLARQLAPG